MKHRAEWCRERIAPKRFTYCGDANCDVFYCRDHRLWYSSCVTSEIGGLEGDGDVVNGLRFFSERSGECPRCEGVARSRRISNFIFGGVHVNR